MMEIIQRTLMMLIMKILTTLTKLSWTSFHVTKNVQNFSSPGSTSASYTCSGGATILAQRVTFDNWHDPIVDRLANHMTNPMTNPKIDFMTDPVTIPMTDPMTSPMTECMNDAMTDPMGQFPTLQVCFLYLWLYVAFVNV